MGLEQEMERYGAFQSRDTDGSTPAAVIKETGLEKLFPAGPCECLSWDSDERKNEEKSGEKKYIIPTATENPAVHRGMVRRWIKNFHEANGMELPSGFYHRDKRQLQGMFYGMLRQYDIKMEQITGPRY